MKNCYLFRFSYLLPVVITTIVLAPIIKDFPFLTIVFNLFLSLTLLTSCAAISTNKLFATISLALAIPLIVAIWSVDFGYHVMPIIIFGQICGILFFAIICISILKLIFAAHQVTWEIIAAALVVYLLLGVMWGLVYALISWFSPGSFSTGQHLLEGANSRYIYYSFITLTTVGYGDILPLSGATRAFAMLEGIIGQGYMAVLVARLVGMQISNTSENK